MDNEEENVTKNDRENVRRDERDNGTRIRATFRLPGNANSLRRQPLTSNEGSNRHEIRRTFTSSSRRLLPYSLKNTFYEKYQRFFSGFTASR